MFSISFFLYLPQESNRGPGIVNVKVGSNCSSDVNGNHAGLFIRELKKMDCFNQLKSAIKISAKESTNRKMCQPSEIYR